MTDLDSWASLITFLSQKYQPQAFSSFSYYPPMNKGDGGVEGMELEVSLIVPHLLHSAWLLFSGLNKPFAFCCGLFSLFLASTVLSRKTLPKEPL